MLPDGLPPFESVMGRIEQMFKSYDLDGDGIVSKSDWLQQASYLAKKRGWVQESQEYFQAIGTFLDVWDQFQAMDTNHDHQITLDEFLAFARQFEDRPQEFLTLNSNLNQALFASMDANEDGQIGEEEFALYLESHGITSPGDHAVEFIEWADNDGDGLISFDEFNQAFIAFIIGDHTANSPVNWLFPIVNHD